MMSVLPFIMFPLFLAALGLAVARLLCGPSFPDRVVALDLLGMVVAGLIAAGALLFRQPMFLDIVLVFALIAFLGTVALARYLEKRRFHDD